MQQKFNKIKFVFAVCDFNTVFREANYNFNNIVLVLPITKHPININLVVNINYYLWSCTL